MIEKKYVIFLALGFEAAALIVAFLYLGSWVDVHYKLNGIGVAGGVFFGLFLWLVHVFAVFRSFEKSEQAGKVPPE